MALKKSQYDIIVVGAGHAGIEAANSAARLGMQVLLFTLCRDETAKLSCNPAVGGVAKGHLVKEVDALGGLIAKVADRCAVGYRRLNKSKGKAVWATRAQVDRLKYPKEALRYLEENPNIRVFQAKVEEIIVKNNKVRGVKTNFSQEFQAAAVIICAGTFLKAKIHIGLNHFKGGRIYEDSSDKLFSNIHSLGLKTMHFKTGTCARIDKRTLDLSKMKEQPPEYDIEPFSFSNKDVCRSQLPCYITYTNKKTHRIINKNLDRSPLYTGIIKSTGVRYCPSLEDKVVKFAHHSRHQVFIEPEGFDTKEIYPNGISSSLPYQVQEEFIHTIPGMENAVVLRPGYGIEYGVINPTQLYPTLEAKKIKGLYFAGQVNGTTGYEEAAAQGLTAGINAALKIKKKPAFVLSRSLAFIGVLIDDLTAKGTSEPYRIFTSRSEFRLSLREDNADVRLRPLAYKLGLVSKNDYLKAKEKEEKIAKAIKKLKSIKVYIKELNKKVSGYNALKMPQVSFSDLKGHFKKDRLSSIEEKEIEVAVKYDGFFKREQRQIKELRKIEKIKLPSTFDFSVIPSLSKETVEKLNRKKPKNLKQALDIEGITPAAAMAIYYYLKARSEE